jgi:hypothetical protein
MPTKTEFFTEPSPKDSVGKQTMNAKAASSFCLIWGMTTNWRNQVLRGEHCFVVEIFLFGIFWCGAGDC